MSTNVFSDETLDPFEFAKDAAAKIAELTGVASHDIALVLGSGWAKAADLMGEEVASIDAAEVPGFTKPHVAGHSAKIRSIKLPSGKHALVLGSRTHLYEGKGVRAVAHAARTAAATGAKIMVLTNGCGGLDTSLQPGTPILISDHINLTTLSPIEGAKFVDLTDLYSSRLRAIAKTVDPTLTEAVYAQFRGPHYETPAEVRMAGIMGAGLVGMSTALEAIAVREAGMELLGISLMTNQAAGIQKTPLSHAEVLEAGREAEARISALLAQIVGKL